MLPKIVISNFVSQEEICDLYGWKRNSLIVFDGADGKVDLLREWIAKAIENTHRNRDLKIVIWNFDELSPECQAILLKPLEDNVDSEIFMLAKKENRILPTIISRCAVVYQKGEDEDVATYWNEIRKCWASGPSACVALSDSLDREEAKKMIGEVIRKMKRSLEVEVNPKRLAVIEEALKCLGLLENSNVNHKLLVDDFLFSSWNLTKT